MDRKRLLELAVEELEKQRASIDAEIEAIRSELKGAGAARTARPVSIAVARRRRRTAAERKAQSEKMKKIWVARRHKAATAKESTPPKAKTQRATVNKAISAAMKAAWARRKAKAAGKTTKTKPAPSKVSPKSAKA